jgi:uncharacterized integral membrane protein
VTTPESRPPQTPGTDPTLGGIPTGPGPATSGPLSSGPPVGGPAATTQRPSAGARAGRTVGRTLALALLVFVTVVLVLFVMFNTQTVDISLVFTDVEAPLVLALLIAAVLGGLVVGLLNAVLGARGRRRNR